MILSGNPRRGSRTLSAAWALADALVPLGAPEQVTEVELADVARYLFGPSTAEVDEALRTVAGARLLIVATPIYKASYTGLLKSFADLYQAGDLHGVLALPLVVAGTSAHLLAAEVHLRPLLIELGATVPTAAVTLVQDDLQDLDAELQQWLAPHFDVLQSALAGQAIR